MEWHVKREEFKLPFILKNLDIKQENNCLKVLISNFLFMEHVTRYCSQNIFNISTIYEGIISNKKIHASYKVYI